MKRLFVIIAVCLCALMKVSAYNSTYNVNVGDQFTVYTTYHNYTYAILWDYDYSVVEPVSYIGSASTSVTFRAIAASPSSGSIIQAVSYYYKNGTTSSGTNKAVDNWKVYVTDPGPTGVTVSPTNLSLDVGDQGYVYATVTPSTSNQTVTWSTSDRSVVSVNSLGHFLAEGPGEAYITATTVNGKSASCYVYVRDPGPTGIDVSPTSLTLDVGGGQWLSASVYPSSADQTVYWETGDRYVATVTSGGYVEATGPGDTYITASTVNGHVARCSVHVNPVEPTSISVSPQRMDVAIGETRSLTYSLLPSNASSTVTWSCTPQGIATVNSSTGAVTGKAGGTATVTATTANSLSASCEVTVYKAQPTQIKLSKTTATMLVGDSERLTYSVEPSYAIYTVTWASTRDDVVQVSQTGQVTAVGSGTATVTVTTDNGKSSSCTVTVPPQPQAVVLSDESLSIIMGRTAKLTYTLQPANARARSVVWQSSNPQVCSVTQDGSLSALRPGEATITATTDNGCSASCSVTVPMPLYQLFVWHKNGEKDGYFSTDHPEFSLEGDAVRFRTDRLTIDIPRDDLDRFTLEQVLPEHPTAITMPHSLLVGYKRSARIPYALTPADAQTSLTWFNSTPDVATVSADGLVSALQPGETTLKVQTGNGLRAECMITVPVPRYRLVVWTADGGKTAYDFANKPEITISGTIFTVASQAKTLKYEATDIRKFTLEDASIATTGDVNGDSTVDVADIATVISVMAGTVGSGFATSADVNGDGTVDVADIATIISIMAGK